LSASNGVKKRNNLEFLKSISIIYLIFVGRCGSTISDFPVFGSTRHDLVCFQFIVLKKFLLFIF
jgi:hypothetical protein